MGFWSRMLGREAKSVGFAAEWERFYELTRVKSGVSVDWDKALDVSTVLACVRVLAEGVAQVPLKVMKTTADGKGCEPAVDHSLYKVLSKRPNKWQTSFAFRETMMFHVVLAGDFIAYKNIVRGEVRELLPFQPGCVEIIRNRDLSLTYRAKGHDGTTQDFPQEVIWHVRGPSWDSWRGLDAVKRAREAIGLAIVTENTQAEMHANGMQASGTYTTDAKIGVEDYKKIQAWIAAQTGGANRHKPFVIDSGFKWTQQTMTGVDTQHLETRKFQIEEICRHFRVFPQMVGHSDKTATFASAEAFFLAHVVHTLMPWFVRIEQSIDADLLDAKKDDGLFAKFNVNALLRGASKDRGEFYAKALGSGGSPAWMTQDEVRGLEDLNPMGGDAAQLPKPTNVALAPSGSADEKLKKDDE